MIEDKLEPEQRIRLECLAQANATGGLGASAEQVVERASRFEDYVREGKK